MSDPVGTMSNGDTEPKTPSTPTKEATATDNAATTTTTTTSTPPPTASSPTTEATPDAKNDNEIQRSPEFLKLKEHGLEDKVATRLEEIYKTGMYF